MNFKTRSSNITKVLYIVLVLCIISIMFLSIYSMFSQKENQNGKDNFDSLNNAVVTNDNALNNSPGYDDSRDAIIDFFKKNTTEAPTEPATQSVTQKPTEAPTARPTESNLPQPKTDVDNAVPEKKAESVIEPAETAVEVISVPTIYLKPVAGSVSRNHNPDLPEYSIVMNDYRTHMGVDIDSEVGVNVKAISDGVISDIYDDPLMGKTVVIDHSGNIQSIYMNLQESLPKNVTVGAAVKGGEVIGGVGETALIEITDVPHLHLEMKKDGNYVNPLDYIQY